VALAQFEGTLVLVSHDRHLLRATTDEFMIVAEGSLRPFDGDLDDYRDWLFKTRLGKVEAKPAKGDTRKPVAVAAPEAKPAPEHKAVAVIAPTGAARQEQKRADAQERQRRANLAKPLETRIKRLEEQIAKLTAKKNAIDTTLAGSAVYEEARKEELKSAMQDQAYVAKELEQAEAEWLEKQAELEALQAA
jgi:ATP-binding cassette, subfamily F, member 3